MKNQIYLIKKLQGENYDLISYKGIITAFIKILQLYKTNISRCVFEQFFCLASICSNLRNDDPALENLRKNFQSNFSDLLKMKVLHGLRLHLEPM